MWQTLQRNKRSLGTTVQQNREQSTEIRKKVSYLTRFCTNWFCWSCFLVSSLLPLWRWTAHQKTGCCGHYLPLLNYYFDFNRYTEVAKQIIVHKWKSIHHSTLRAILRRNGVFHEHNINNDIGSNSINYITFLWRQTFETVSFSGVKRWILWFYSTKMT